MADKQVFQGTITAVLRKEAEEKIDGEPKWVRISYDIDNQRFSTFDTKFQGFKAGDVIRGFYEQKGQYRNIVDAEKTGEEVFFKEKPEFRDGLSFQERIEEKERRKQASICKQNALTNSIKFVEILIENNRLKETDKPLDFVMVLREEFYRWNMGELLEDVF